MAADRDSLADFTRQYVTVAGKRRLVFRRGDGPPVVLMSEIPGITPKIADLARRLGDASFDVWMPSLYGLPGFPVSTPAVASRTAWICVSREVRALSKGITRPLATWVRALAEHIQATTNAEGVGVVGLCLTASVALGAAVSPAVAASVVSQPSMPLPLSPGRIRDAGVSVSDLQAVRERVITDEFCALGLRFSADRLSPKRRFQTIADALGDGFIMVEIDSSRGNPDGIPSTVHSVLGHDYVDSPGHPTRLAFERLTEFLHLRLDRGGDGVERG